MFVLGNLSLSLGIGAQVSGLATTPIRTKILTTNTYKSTTIIFTSRISTHYGKFYARYSERSGFSFWSRRRIFYH
jgi:hypothetical protein